MLQRLRFNPFGAGRGLSTLFHGFYSEKFTVSIPLEQGGVFRQIIEHGIAQDRKVSIPLEQGGVFRQIIEHGIAQDRKVSIPLEQGGVFRQQGWFGALLDKA